MYSTFFGLVPDHQIGITAMAAGADSYVDPIKSIVVDTFVSRYELCRTFLRAYPLPRSTQLKRQPNNKHDGHLPVSTRRPIATHPLRLEWTRDQEL
jgi:hypothetical protein